MKLIVLVLALLMLTPMCLAEVDFGKTFDQYLNNATGTISTATGHNTTDEGGGGDPFSCIKDPMIKWANETFHTNHGWVVVYAILFLVLAILNVAFILAGIMGYVGFLLGEYVGFEQPSLFAAIFMLIGFFIGLTMMKRSPKIRKVSKVMLMVLIAMIVILVGYLVLSSLGLLPNWMIGL